MHLSRAFLFRPLPATSFIRSLTGAAIVALAASGYGVSMVPIGKPLPPIPGTSHMSGNPSPSSPVFVAISLKPRDSAGLQACANDVSNPHSPNYRHFLTPAQVGSRFGASTADINAVVSYLRSKGFTIKLQARNGMGILAAGTVAKAQTAFGTTIKGYHGISPDGLAINFYSNTTVLKMPSNIASKILDISGVCTYPAFKRRSTQTLTPVLTRILYGNQPAFLGGDAGSGRTVGVSNFDGYRLSNVPIWYQTYGLPTPAGGVGSNITVVPVGTPTGPGTPNGEGDLDIQMELGQAPLADQIIYDGSDLLQVLTQEAGDDAADIISESYGWNPAFLNLNAVHNQHLIMTTQGQTYLLATGDNGTTLEPFSYANFDPELLQVGGTVATVDDQTGARQTEVGWAGSGGGWSTNGASFNRLPSWQVGNGVPTNIDFRLCPDLALHAAGNGGAYFFIFGGGIATGDGTSFASPVCCGNLAILEERLDDLGINPRLGRFQDFVYSLNGDPTCFFDVTSGSNGTLPNGQTSNAGLGWDFVTGWGAPNFDGLFNVLSAGGGGSGTPIPPDSATTVIGTYDDGDQSSLATSDGVFYAVDSADFPQFGTAAGLDASFTIPSGINRISIQCQAFGNQDGGVTMAWAFNWTTGVFDLIGETPMSSVENDPATIKIRSNVPNYIGPGNQVVVRLRGHYPNRPNQGQFPGDFTYEVDLFQLIVQ